MKNRFLSVLLSICLIGSLVSTNIAAATVEENELTTEILSSNTDISTGIISSNTEILTASPTIEINNSDSNASSPSTNFMSSSI